MNSEVLPPLVIKPIEKVSPSRYYSLKSCELRGILEENSYSQLTPTHPSAYVGQIIHRILQMAILGRIPDERAIQTEWDSLCRETERKMMENLIEKHMVPLESSANDFEVKKRLLFTMVNKHMLLPSTSAQKEKPKAEPEAKYVTEDGKIVGRIDLIRYTDSGIEIIDYKTGHIADYRSGVNSPLPEYQLQLKLYAGLFYSVKKEWPARLVLIGIDQSEYNIEFNKDECLRLLAAAKSDLERINRRITEGSTPETFANPSPDSCRYCPFRPSCKAYWKGRQTGGAWPNDVIGKVMENKLLGNGLRRVVIMTDDQKVIAIRGLSPDRHKFLDQSPIRVLFCDLGNDIKDGFYTEQMLTVGYKDDGILI